MNPTCWSFMSHTMSHTICVQRMVTRPCGPCGSLPGKLGSTLNKSMSSAPLLPVLFSSNIASDWQAMCTIGVTPDFPVRSCTVNLAGKTPQGCPLQHYKDQLKPTVMKSNNNLKTWENQVKKIINSGVKPSWHLDRNEENNKNGEISAKPNHDHLQLSSATCTDTCFMQG